MAMTTSLRRLTAFVVFALVTVEFGGWSLLGLLTTRDALTPFQEQFFRAGHGHAGVLLVLALVYLVLMPQTSFSSSTQRWLSVVLLAGILLQSGGFFLHLVVGEAGAPSLGTAVTRLGALLLAAALIGLGIGILRAGRATPTPAAR
jgi:hypothetical protein